MLLEARHLRCLIAVAEERSITRAAARLGLPQPALSKQIRRIETTLRVRVFARSASGVDVTADGGEAIRLARLVLRDLDGIAEDARKAVPGPDSAERRTIRFASMATTLRSALSKLERRLGNVTFQQSVLPPPLDLNGLREGRFDVIYTIDNEYAPVQVHPPLRQATVVVEPVWVAMGVGHRLAASTDPVNLSDLARERWVTWPEGSVFHSLVVGACAKAGFTPHIEAQTSDLWALVQLVGEGFLSFASPATILPPNRARPLTGGPEIRVLIAWNEEKIDSAEVDALLVLAREWYFGSVKERNPAYWDLILGSPEDFPGHELVDLPA